MDKELIRIIKNTTAYKIFDRDIGNSFSHAYLLLSSDSIALDSLLTAVIMRVYCKDACMECVECKKVVNLVKPDVTYVNPEGENVTVEQLNEMIDSTYLTPVERGDKIYVIKAFNTQSTIIQNKLLKTLEEPPVGVHILLTATSDIGILPTVLSRVKKVTQSPIHESELRNWLYHRGVPNYREMARVADGSVTVASKLSEDESFINEAYELVNIYNSIGNSSDVPNYVNNRAFADIVKALDTTEIIFKDVLYVKSDLEYAVTFGDLTDLYHQLSQSLTLSGIAEIMDEISLSKHKTTCYINNINIIDCFLLKIAEEKSKCKK